MHQACQRHAKNCNTQQNCSCDKKTCNQSHQKHAKNMQAQRGKKTPIKNEPHKLKKTCKNIMKNAFHLDHFEVSANQLVPDSSCRGHWTYEPGSIACYATSLNLHLFIQCCILRSSSTLCLWRHE